MLNSYKDTISEYFNFIATVLVLMLLIAASGFALQISTNPTFSAYAEGVVSRHGGLTEPAATEITDYSNEHFGGRYQVLGWFEQGADGKEFKRLTNGYQTPKGYGEEIEFAITGKYKFIMFNIPILDMDLRVQAVSRRR